MSQQAIGKELSRVRELKRNAEATINLLRSDMEQGKIHLRVNESQEFRQKVAEALVTEAHPGYHSQGYYYADPVDGEVYYRQTNASWNPWSESVDWRIVPVSELANEGSFDPSADWSAADLPDYREMVEAYLESLWFQERQWPMFSDYREMVEAYFEDNGDIPDWVNKIDVINFASEDNRWKKEIEEIESISYEQAVSFALSEIKDETVIDLSFY